MSDDGMKVNIGGTDEELSKLIEDIDPRRSIEVNPREVSNMAYLSFVLYNISLFLIVFYIALKVTPWALLGLFFTHSLKANYDVKISGIDSEEDKRSK